MGPLSTCIFQSLPEIRNPNNRFIRFKGFTPSSTICCMETRSLQHRHGRNVNFLETGSLLRIFPIMSDPLCTRQNTTRPSTDSNIDNTLLANTVVVSTSVRILISTPVLIPCSAALLIGRKESPSICVKQNSYVSGMERFWEELSLQGVSEETTQLIAKSRRQSTLGNYKLVWKEWSN